MRLVVAQVYRLWRSVPRPGSAFNVAGDL